MSHVGLKVTKINERKLHLIRHKSYVYARSGIDAARMDRSEFRTWLSFVTFEKFVKQQYVRQ